MDRNISDSTYKVYNALGDLMKWLISENQRLNREIMSLKQKSTSEKFDELIDKSAGTESDILDTGLYFHGHPVLFGPDRNNHKADKLDLTRLDRFLFKHCRKLYENQTCVKMTDTAVDGAFPWTECKGPRSSSERAAEAAEEHAKAFVRKCLERKWYQFWK